jgi:ferrous iron transport protein A
MPTLADLRPGQSAAVVSLAGDPALVQRLYELGLFEGEPVEVLALAPLGDPIEVRVGNSRLSLRKAEAANIEVSTEYGVPSTQ